MDFGVILLGDCQGSAAHLYLCSDRAGPWKVHWQVTVATSYPFGSSYYLIRLAPQIEGLALGGLLMTVSQRFRASRCSTLRELNPLCANCAWTVDIAALAGTAPPFAVAFPADPFEVHPLADLPSDLPSACSSPDCFPYSACLLLEGSHSNLVHHPFAFHSSVSYHSVTAVGPPGHLPAVGLVVGNSWSPKGPVLH